MYKPYILSLSDKYKHIAKIDKLHVFLNKYTGNWFTVSSNMYHLIEQLRMGLSLDQFKVLSQQEKIAIHTLRIGSVFKNDIKTNSSKENKVQIVLIEPVDYCNLACKYCFENVKRDGVQMSIPTAKKIISKIEQLDLSNELTIEFNGGESFLNTKILKYIITKSLSSPVISKRKLSFAVQTNGTVFNDEILRLIKKYKMKIGLSIDGYSDDHDKYRIFDDGIGSHRHSFKFMTILKKHDLPFSIIAVITSPDQIARSFEFFLKNRVRNIMFVLRRYSERLTKCIDNQTELAKCHIDIFHESLNLFKKKLYTPILVEFTIFIKNILNPDNPPFMCQRTPCGAGINMIVFNTQGDVYPCQDLINEPQFLISPSTSKDVGKDIMCSGVLRKLSERRPNTLNKCRKCNWQRFCQGGCYSGSYFSSDKSFVRSLKTENPHCEYYSYIFRELLKLMAIDPISLVKYAFSLNTTA